MLHGLGKGSDKRGLSILTPDNIFCVHLGSDLQQDFDFLDFIWLTYVDLRNY